MLFSMGIALRFRSLQAGPLMQTPVFLVLFLAPVYVPLPLLQGWIHGVATVNPATAVLEGARDLISGSSGHVSVAFVAVIAVALALLVFTARGLRKAEQAGG
jgi:ABC-2 type transport system permease protein